MIYWHTCKAGSKVDQRSPTEFGRALQQIGIETGITDMATANEYLDRCYRQVYNAEFAQPALEPGSALAPWAGALLDGILCEQFERKVGADNGVTFGPLTLRIPRQRHRCHRQARRANTSLSR